MEWISIKDRLPKDDEDVLIYNYYDGICVGYFTRENISSYIEKDGTITFVNDGWSDNYPSARHEGPSHWMPLPEFPGASEWRPPTLDHH